MSTLGNILSNAGQALQAHQKATQVAGHNISNALTEGYSRQRAELATAHPLQTPYGTIGGGVRLADITRARDALLDITVRRENSAAEGHRLRHQMLGQIEASLLEFGDGGFATTLDAFWDAWGDLASHPGNDAARVMVQNRGEQVAGHLSRMAGEIEELEQIALSRLLDGVSNLNRLANNVADLNRQIIAAEAGGGTAADLRDSRDRALDEMAKLTPIQVVERQNGGIGVMVGGISLVDDAVTRVLSVDLTPGSFTVVRTDNGTRLQESDGQLGALADLLNRELPGLRGQLDDLARGIAQSVNELHRQGVARGIDPVSGLPSTGLDFFHVEGDDLANVHARNLRLSDAIAADPSFIAIGRGNVLPDGSIEYLAGNTEIALAIGRLRDTPLGDPLPSGEANVLGNKTIAGYYQGIVTGLGARAASAKAATTAHETLARQAEIRRESVSGVSTDEEMIKLIQSQTAYQAAARVITTVDEMLQTILNL
jgi:flagellar hook-associated protein 1 FlgK